MFDPRDPRVREAMHAALDAFFDTLEHAAGAAMPPAPVANDAPAPRRKPSRLPAQPRTVVSDTAKERAKQSLARRGLVSLR